MYFSFVTNRSEEAALALTPFTFWASETTAEATRDQQLVELDRKLTFEHYAGLMERSNLVFRVRASYDGPPIVAVSPRDDSVTVNSAPESSMLLLLFCFDVLMRWLFRQATRWLCWMRSSDDAPTLSVI